MKLEANDAATKVIAIATNPILYYEGYKKASPGYAATTSPEISGLATIAFTYPTSGNAGFTVSMMDAIDTKWIDEAGGTQDTSVDNEIKITYGTSGKVYAKLFSTYGTCSNNKVLNAANSNCDCPTGKYLHTTADCLCPEGTFAAGEACTACHADCLTCSAAGADKCLSCKGRYNFKVGGTDPAGVCKCTTAGEKLKIAADF